ncbi:carbohydrate binding domain-containing protein [Paenibacillus sp. GYB004]|uniref:heparin/heparin-sulfate lyase HepB n=1 Tax=Paenibacillus sp. GYB004 TaxID=2994393 RepID=UPI002F968F08
MKKKATVWLLVLLLCLGMLPPLSQQAKAEALALLNGGFESGLVGWSRLFGNAANMAVTSEHYQSGGFSLRIEDKESNTGYAVISGRHPVVPGKQYMASAKINIISGHGAIYFYFYDAAGAMIHSVSSVKSSPLGSWTDVAISAVPPAGATEVAVVLATGMANVGRVYFDTVALNRVSLIANGGFESGLQNWNAAFGSAQRMTAVTDPKFSGSYSLKLDDNSATSSLGMESDKFPVVPGKSYTAEARVRVDSGSAALYLRYYNAAGVQLDQVSKGQGATQGLWQAVTASMVAPPGAAKASIIVYSSSASVGVMYFDDVSLSDKTMLQGTVTDAADAAPVPWANAYLYPAADTGLLEPIDKAVTNAAGKYTFGKGVQDGSYVVSVSKDGYAAGTVAVEIGTSPVSADLAIAKDTAAERYTVGGKVRVPASATPLAGAAVSLYDDNDTGYTTSLGAAVSAADGTFTLDRQVVNGRYVARAVKPGYYTTTFPVTVNGSSHTSVDLQVPAKEDVTTENMPKPPAAHPRLYVTPELVTQLQAKIATPHFQPIWTKLLQGSYIPVYTGKSSGATLDFETYPFPSAEQARYVKLFGRGNSVNQWNSITETEIYTQDTGGGKVKLPVQSAAWSSQDRQYDGNNTIDGNLDAESRWSAEGAEEWIVYDLGSVQSVSEVDIAWYSGNTRFSYFDIYVSADGQSWKLIELGLGKPPGWLDPPPPGGINYSARTKQAIEFNAMKYLLRGDAASGRLAIEAIQNFMDTAVYGGLDTFRPIGDTMFAAALVYDWCYPLLEPEDKTAIIAGLKRLAGRMSIGYPNIRYGAINGHYSENQLMKDFLTAGAAIYDEDPEMYNLSAKRFFEEYVPARNFWYLSGMHHQGASYGFGVRYTPELWAQWLFDRMGHGSVFVPEQGDVILRGIYSRRPDGQMLVDGDTGTGHNNAPGVYWKYTPALMLAASYYKDPYLLDEFKRQYTPGSDLLSEILFVEPELPAKPVGELPLTRYFGFPYGSMIARTGWDADGAGGRSSDVVAEMKIGSYQFGNHQHFDSGGFQLYYKGGLAIDSGMYGGTNGQYGSEHDRHYYKRTIAHNAMLVYDPADPQFGDWANDGGQRYIPSATGITDLLGKNNYVSPVVGQQFGPDLHSPNFSYIKGDLTAAYSDKVQQYERSFVFLNLKDATHPAAMIVYDKVKASDPNFKKYWLLHSMEEPQVSGNTTTIVRSEGGYEGKLVNETLLPGPGGAVIEKVGGPGHEFDVFGANYPQATRSANHTIEAGAWRVQVSPAVSSETDRFLNVLQVMDNDGTAPLQTGAIDSEKMVGAAIGDYAVLFSKAGVREQGTVAFAVYGGGERQYVVTDLASGTWKISGASGEFFGEVSEEGGVLYFTGPAGVYTLTYMGAADLVPPVTKATADGVTGPGTFNNRDVTVTFDVYDLLSGVDRTEYRLNGGAWTTVTGSVYLQTDGVYALDYRSVDRAGNVEAPKQLVIGIDQSPPTATIAYSSTVPTREAVTAVLTPSKPVTITNNGGSDRYTFTENGSFTFEFTDWAGRSGTATAAVANIVASSTGTPGKPVLSDDNGHDTGIRDGTYTVTMNMWWGNNGTTYKLYESDVLLDTQSLIDRGPNAQSTVTNVTYRDNGTYRYYAELSNAYGTTRSDVLTVVVTQATPSQPVISDNNWDGDGQYQIEMNLWWGTNGSTYRLYENGVLIDTQTLAVRTPQAQRAVTTVQGKPPGVYEYRAELANASGAVSSAKLIVHVVN